MAVDEEVPVALLAVPDGPSPFGSTIKFVTLIIEASEGVGGSMEVLLVGAEPDAPVSVGSPEAAD